MDQKIFNRMNAVLFMVQDDAVLRRIMESSFSIQYDVTLKQAIIDFYTMKQYQLLKPEYLNTVDHSVIEKGIVKALIDGVDNADPGGRYRCCAGRLTAPSLALIRTAFALYRKMRII
jgi:hypothetical protein